MLIDVADAIRDELGKREVAARRNRERMPDTAAMVDSLEACFGKGQVKVRWAKEGSIEMGKRMSWNT